MPAPFQDPHTLEPRLHENLRGARAGFFIGTGTVSNHLLVVRNILERRHGKAGTESSESYEDGAGNLVFTAGVRVAGAHIDDGQRFLLGYFCLQLVGSYALNFGNLGLVWLGLGQAGTPLAPMMPTPRQIPSPTQRERNFVVVIESPPLVLGGRLLYHTGSESGDPDAARCGACTNALDVFQSGQSSKS